MFLPAVNITKIGPLAIFFTSTLQKLIVTLVAFSTLGFAMPADGNNLQARSDRYGYSDYNACVAGKQAIDCVNMGLNYRYCISRSSRSASRLVK